MPVFPLVASTIVVRPGSMRPSRSAASIMATPMRSLTEPPGLYISSLPNTSAPPSGARRANWTIGVRPTWSAMLIGVEALWDLVWQRLLVVVDAPSLPHPGALVELDRVGVVGGDVQADLAAFGRSEHSVEQAGAEAAALVPGVDGEEGDVERPLVPAADEGVAAFDGAGERVIDAVAVELSPRPFVLGLALVAAVAGEGFHGDRIERGCVGGLDRS